MSATYVKARAALATMSPLGICNLARELVQELKNLRRDELDCEQRWLEAMRELQSLVPDGKYEYFESTPQEPKYYSVVGIAQSVEPPFECWITCAAQYGPHEGVPCIWPLYDRSRGVFGFLSPVHAGGKMISRFKLIRAGGVELLAGNIRGPYLGPHRPGVD
jgi:hypothetical protein